MPTAYMIDVSKNARAMCKNKECKDAGVKIQKDELRFGTLVTINEHTSWTYKHWGCVTPAQVANLIEFTGGDIDMVDGYDDVPPEIQEKVKFALENGHVPDEDWKGDVEVNRPGQKGFRAKIKTPKKKKDNKAVQDDDAADKEPKPKAKRGRAVKGDDDDAEAPATKKSRGKKVAIKNEDGDDDQARPKKAAKKAATKAEDEAEGEEPKPKKATGRPKKTAVKDEEEEEQVEKGVEEEESKPKKAKVQKTAVKKTAEPKSASSRAKRSTAKAPTYDEASDCGIKSDATNAEPEAPKAKRGKKKAAAAPEEKPAPQKRSRQKVAVSED